MRRGTISKYIRYSRTFACGVHVAVAVAVPVAVVVVGAVVVAVAVIVNISIAHKSAEEEEHEEHEEQGRKSNKYAHANRGKWRRLGACQGRLRMQIANNFTVLFAACPRRVPTSEHELHFRPQGPRLWICKIWQKPRVVKDEVVVAGGGQWGRFNSTRQIKARVSRDAIEKMNYDDFNANSSRQRS